MKVHIPTPLRPYAGKSTTVEVRATTVGEALYALIAKHGELKRHLYNDDGKTYAYEKGGGSVTKLTWDDAAHHLTREGASGSSELDKATVVVIGR